MMLQPSFELRHPEWLEVANTACPFIQIYVPQTNDVLWLTPTEYDCRDVQEELQGHERDDLTGLSQRLEIVSDAQRPGWLRRMRLLLLLYLLTHTRASSLHLLIDSYMSPSDPTANAFYHPVTMRALLGMFWQRIHTMLPRTPMASSWISRIFAPL